MPYRGLPPKDEDARVNRNPHRNTTTVTPDGKIYGPDLPDHRNWNGRAREWWHTQRTSAQAQLFEDTDWEFLMETAILIHDIWDPNIPHNTTYMTMMAEARQRVIKFGATWEDRQKLALQIKKPLSNEEEEKQIKEEAEAAVNYAEAVMKYAAKAKEK